MHILLRMRIPIRSKFLKFQVTIYKPISKLFLSAITLYLFNSLDIKRVVTRLKNFQIVTTNIIHY